MTVGALLTIDDYERLPAEVAENHELIDGGLVDVSGNTPRHNLVRDRLIALLWLWVREQKAGTVIAEQEYDFLGNAHGPDVSFFGPAKQMLMDLDKRVQRFVPDLAVEIASDSDTYEGLLSKKERYLRAGTTEVWLIAPKTRDIAIYNRLGVRVLRGGDPVETELIPGFSATVDELLV
jgi:Uma2 family endonuclease